MELDTKKKSKQKRSRYRMKFEPMGFFWWNKELLRFFDVDVDVDLRLAVGRELYIYTYFQAW